MRTLMITVGTSLLSNQGWKRGGPLPDQTQATAALKAADLKAACAETNTLEALPLRENDRLTWLHSDTEEGRWCAEALASFYSGRGYDCPLEPISALDYHAATFGDRGLKSLLDVAFKVIREAESRQRSVLICATGGFKAEIAFMNLIGLLMQIPVCYIHEHFREIVLLPRLPIDWNTQAVTKNEAFFTWIDDTDEPRKVAEVEGWLKASPELRPLVQEAEDGCVYLTAAGDLLYRAYKEREQRGPRVSWSPDSRRAPAEKNQVSLVGHHRPDGWEAFVDRLIREMWVESVRYDGSGTHGAGGTRVYGEYPEEHELGVVYCKGDKALPLRIGTTAQDAAQLSLLRDHLEKQLKRW